MRIKMVATAVVAVAISSMVGFTQTTPVEAAKKEKVTICHRTNSVDNPYRQITVAKSAVDGVAGNSGQKPDHFGEHKGPLATSKAVAQALKDSKTKWGDIIPPVLGFHNGLNWSAEGQAIYNNDCKPTVDYCDPTQRPGGMSIKQWVPNEVRCVEPWVEVSCGEFNGGVTNLLTGPSWTQDYALVWSEGVADYNQFVAPPAEFAEDYNGGSVEVFYWVVGPEADYITDRNIPNFWEQNAESVTVDTDCEEPGRGGGVPTEPKEPTTPAKEEEVVSLPGASGTGEVAALISLSTLSVLTIAGALVRRHFGTLSL